MAKTNETNFLSELSVRSKAYWPYEKEFIEDAREDLQLNSNLIKEGLVYVITNKSKIVGFYAFQNTEVPEMIALFVDPDYIGKGFGMKLWNHALQLSAKKNWPRFTIVADPFAAKKFYSKIGCKKIGEVESPVRKGRKLPLLEFNLENN